MDRAVELNGLDERTCHAITSATSCTDVDVVTQDSDTGHIVIAGDLVALLDELKYRGGNMDDYTYAVRMGSMDAENILQDEVKRFTEHE